MEFLCFIGNPCVNLADALDDLIAEYAEMECVKPSQQNKPLQPVTL